MWKNWKQKWRVNDVQLVLILCTFALGGSTCGFLAKKALPLFGELAPLVKTPLYFILVTLLWPVCVILISIPFGQFTFFKNYLSRMGKRLFGRKQEKKAIQIAIFASGTGSNAAKILAHLQNNTAIKVALIVTNKPKAGVLEHAKTFGVPTLHIDKEYFFNGHHYLPELRQAGIDFIVLAGFLWKMPEAIVKAFPQAIINIHPALLPKYGGKGMYGQHVHAAVLANGETESGITIHYVDEQYDHGDHIYQATCPVLANDTPDSLAARVHQLEHAHFPRIVEEIALQKAVK